ncbi:MAG: antitoxin [Lentimonas sp.]
MRTTVTLDPDVEHFIREACHKRRKSFKRVLNDALRESLKPAEIKRALLPPRSMGLATGIDPRRLSDMADELEADAYLATEDPAACKDVGPST